MLATVRRTFRMLALFALLVTPVLLLVSPASATGPASGVVFDSIPSTLPGNVASESFEATSTSEFGDYATFAGTARALRNVDVVMSSWGCGTGNWTDGSCATTPAATFPHLITLTIYANNGGSPGAVVGSVAQTFAIPFRPSADPTNCTAANAGKWFSTADHTCYNGFATTITFDFSSLHLTLPSSVIYDVSYNTTHYGAAPIGESAACYASSGGCGYDSLNVGAASTTPFVGSDNDPNGVFLNSSFAGSYCDLGVGGTGTFRLDTSCWTGNNPLVQFNACTPTGFMRDGIDMTAAQIGGNVTGDLNASGCNIGVYYDSTHSGNVTGANIHDANYYGVVVNGDIGTVNANVTGSTIHDIGETPLNGTQHGNAIYYRALGTGTASGTISGNTLTNYQKGGITVNGNVSATITNNIVTGKGPVNYIAQNGIQVGYGAKATVTGNTVSGNAYTGANLASSAGILVVGGACFGFPATVGLDISKNALTGNDVGVWLFNAAADCASAPTTKTNNSVKFNTISNNAVTNTTGFSATCGYQAGVSDVGTKDQIVNNSISGIGYTKQAGGDCTGTPPAFLRFVDAGSSARGVGSNK
jgi:parallel beta-helix repeat protein